MLGQLCRLPSDVLAKQVFVNRLTRFLLLYSQFQGFIPGIHAIAKKFCLEAYLKHYCTTNCCTKQTWKCTLKRAIYGRLATRYTREPQKQLTENDPRGRILSRPFSSTCNRCDLTVHNVAEHRLSLCWCAKISESSYGAQWLIKEE